MFRPPFLWAVIHCAIYLADMSAEAAEPTSPQTRAEFAAAMARLKEGSPAEQVRELLGDPDDILRESDTDFVRSGTKEIWCYGTDGHLTFATLGRVVFDRLDQVLWMYGNTGQPPSPEEVPEDELRELLRLMDRLPGCGGWNYNPRRVIETVNALQPLGKDKALAVVSEYLRITPYTYDGDVGVEGTFLVLRLLFEVPDDPGYMPGLGLGQPEPGPPANPRKLPLFPLALVGDIPFLLVEGHSLSGFPGHPGSDVEYFREHGEFRARPLAPVDRPIEALMLLVRSQLWQLTARHADVFTHQRSTLCATNQLLWLVDSAHDVPIDDDGYKLSVFASDEEWWGAVRALANADIRWNPEVNGYVRADGTYDSEDPEIHFPKIFWTINGPNGTPIEVTVARLRGERVSVGLTSTWTRGENEKSARVVIYRAGDRTTAIHRIVIPHPAVARIQSRNPSPRSRNAMWSMSTECSIPQGSEIELVWKWMDDVQQSPVLKP